MDAHGQRSMKMLIAGLNTSLKSLIAFSYFEARNAMIPLRKGSSHEAMFLYVSWSRGRVLDVDVLL